MRPKSVSILVYAGIACCFFLPWVEVSCGALSVNASAYELAKGSVPEEAEFSRDLESLNQEVANAIARSKNYFWLLFLVPALALLGMMFPLCPVGPHSVLSVLFVLFPMATFAYSEIQLSNYLSALSAGNELGIRFVEVRPAIGAWCVADSFSRDFQCLLFRYGSIVPKNEEGGVATRGDKRRGSSSSAS